MFPEEIIEILQKYQDNNSELLYIINKNISDIIEKLYSVNQKLAEQIKDLLLDKDTNNNAKELMNDSITLRDYIKSIRLLDIENELHNNRLEETAEEISPVIVDNMPKPVKLFLCEDNVCPVCDCSMDETYTSFTTNIKSKLEKETIDTYRCNCCNRFFVCDFAISDINLANTNLVINREYYNKIPSINIHTLVVLKSTLKCFTHKTHDLIAQLPGLDKNGNVFYHSIDASYCPICNRFTVIKDDFNAIKNIIMCKVVDETYANSVDSSKNNYNLENSSILTTYGYNVQTQKNISKQQRHIILSSIIESDIMNRREVIDHINTLIQRGSKIESWSNATQKWREDIEFVKIYRKEDLPKVVFDKIVLKYKRSI